MLVLYPLSVCGGMVRRRQFNHVQSYCMFVGYPRSGHSVIGRLLDAHPKIVIAHQLGALQLVHLGFGRSQIFYLLARNSRLFAEAGSSWSGYSCHIPTQWQGRFEKLRVIGDKQGQGATLRLRARPWLLPRLRRRVGCSVKLIHVIRNPYDNISTIHRRAAEQGSRSELKDSVETYFSLCEAVAAIRAGTDSADWFEIKHESFIEDPKACLAELCGFLGVSASSNYLEDCAGVVFEAPHRSRFEAAWNRALIDEVD